MSRIIWIYELTCEGARNLLRHKMRSLLSLLGIVIGVGSVIAMMAIGEGAQRKVLKDIGGLGLHNIIIDSEKPTAASLPHNTGENQGAFRYGLTPRDVEQVRSLFPAATLLVGHLVKKRTYYQSTRLDVAILGVAPEYFDAFPMEVREGYTLAEVDNRDRHRVAVITEEAARRIPAAGGALGTTIQIGGNYFQVIGVIRMPSGEGVGRVFLPYNTAKDLFGTITAEEGEAGSSELTINEIGRMVIHLEDEAIIPEAAAVVEKMLKKNHEMNDFTMTVPLAKLQLKQQTQRTFDLVLIVIAVISLVIGGIGIMNIMLAIVMERIQEIGIRRALGASRRDILLQFLSETVVLSTSGGILGCLLGAAAVPLLSRLTEWPGVFTPSAILIALMFSWLVGIVFGIAPAIQAAKMNPVECLRYE